ALRAGRVMVDVAHDVEVARAAVRAALDGAVRREPALEGAREVLLQELLRQPRVEMIPGKRLRERAAAEVERGVDLVLRERRLPHVDATVIRPAVEAGAPPLRRLD